MNSMKEVFPTPKRLPTRGRSFNLGHSPHWADPGTAVGGNAAETVAQALLHLDDSSQDNVGGPVGGAGSNEVSSDGGVGAQGGSSSTSRIWVYRRPFARSRGGSGAGSSDSLSSFGSCHPQQSRRRRIGDVDSPGYIRRNFFRRPSPKPRSLAPGRDPSEDYSSDSPMPPLPEDFFLQSLLRQHRELLDRQEREAATKWAESTGDVLLQKELEKLPPLRIPPNRRRHLRLTSERRCSRLRRQQGHQSPRRRLRVQRQYSRSSGQWGSAAEEDVTMMAADNFCSAKGSTAVSNPLLLPGTPIPLAMAMTENLEASLPCGVLQQSPFVELAPPMMAGGDEAMWDVAPPPVPLLASSPWMLIPTAGPTVDYMMSSRATVPWIMPYQQDQDQEQQQRQGLYAIQQQEQSVLPTLGPETMMPAVLAANASPAPYSPVVADPAALDEARVELWDNMSFGFFLRHLGSGGSTACCKRCTGLCRAQVRL